MIPGIKKAHELRRVYAFEIDLFRHLHLSEDLHERSLQASGVRSESSRSEEPFSIAIATVHVDPVNAVLDQSVNRFSVGVVLGRQALVGVLKMIELVQTLVAVATRSK